MLLLRLRNLNLCSFKIIKFFWLMKACIVIFVWSWIWSTCLLYSTGNFLSGTLNRVHHMLGSGRTNRKIMCYIAGGVVVFITIIYMLSSKLRSADWFEDQLIFDPPKNQFWSPSRSIFRFQKVYNCQMSTLHIFIQIHILLRKK